MAENGEINGHRPRGLLERVVPGPAPVSAAGLGQVPDAASAATGAVTALRTEVPENAYTASFLGAERGGSAVVIDESGLAVTIGYLLLECRRIALVDADGDWVDAAFVGYDFETGFGLARAQRPLGLEPVALGESAPLKVGDRVTVAGPGGQSQAMLTEMVSRRSFAGYWEYLLDDALFTSPVYPNWSGAGLIGNDGRLLGIGSLLVEEPSDDAAQGNMFVPIDLLHADPRRYGGRGPGAAAVAPLARVFTTETQGSLLVAQVAEDGPAARSGIEPGDVIVRVARVPIADLGDFYRRVWAVGSAGATVPLTIVRGGASLELAVRSADRYAHFKTPRG